MKSKSLGQTIRDLREERDISLRELKKLVGVSAPYLSDIELGRRFPSEDVLQKIAHALGVDFEVLRALDPRPPMDELKRATDSDPAFGFALRQVLEKNVSVEDLRRLAQELTKKKL